MEFFVPGAGVKADFTRPGWVCMYDYPFSLGLRFPFPPLIQRFLVYTKVAPAQLVPHAWRILLCVTEMNRQHNSDVELVDLAHFYNTRSLGGGQVTMRLSGVSPIIIPKMDDMGWYSRFIFVKKDTLPAPCDYIHEEWRATSEVPAIPLSECIETSRLKFLALPANKRNLSCLLTGEPSAVTDEDLHPVSESKNASRKRGHGIDKIEAIRKKRGFTVGARLASRKAAASVDTNPASKLSETVDLTASDNLTDPQVLLPIASDDKTPTADIPTPTYTLIPNVPSAAAIPAGPSVPAAAIPAGLSVPAAATNEKPASASEDSEVVMKFPADYAKNREKRSMDYMHQMLFPAPKAVFDKKVLQDVASHSTDCIFRALQASLYVQGAVSNSDAKVAEQDKKIAQLQEELNIQKEAKLREQMALHEEHGLKLKQIQDNLEAAQKQVIAKEEEAEKQLKEKGIRIKQLEFDLSIATNLHEGYDLTINTLENKVKVLKDTLVDIVAYTAAETRISCMLAVQKGEHNTWDLEAEERALKKDFPVKPNLDILSGSYEDDGEDGSSEDQEVESAAATQDPDQQK